MSTQNMHITNRGERIESDSIDILEELMDIRREEAEAVQTIAPPEEERKSDSWVGHDLSTKTSETGIRVATLNTQKKFFANELNWETIAELIKELAIDIMVITEAGKADEMRIASLKNWAMRQSMSADVINRSNISISGGIVVLTSSGLAGVSRSIHRYQPEKGDRDRGVAIEYNNGIEGDHNKVMIMGYYGYNASQTVKDKVTELHKWVWKTKSKFKRDNWQAPVVLMGDLNAAYSSKYDTDRESATEEQREPDAATIEHLETLGFHDPLRQDYPYVRLTTRRLNHGSIQTMRYLDRILMSSEISSHFSTRVGIYQPAIFGIDDTDHKMVVADLPIDIAGTAVKRAQVWDVHKRTIMRWDGDELGNMEPEKVIEYNRRAKESVPEGVSPTEVTKWLREAGRGSVLKEVIQEFPRKVRKLKDFQMVDWTMRRNAKIVREVLRRIDQGIHPGEALGKTHNLKDVQGTPHEDIRYKLTWDPAEDRASLVHRLEEIMGITREYASRENRKQRAIQIKDNIERRNKRFNDPNKKSLKAVITSIMRRARLNEQVLVQTRGEGKGIATEPPEVAKEVIKFYREWMKSRVPWEQRWKSWEGMMELDRTQLVDDGYSDFVEDAYRESFVKYGRMQEEEGIWDEVWRDISMEDMQKALNKFKSGKAGGPSGITYDLLKALDEENLGPILGLMRQCLKDRALPKELNRSMIRALAKTEQGLADLNMTRPIALMEALGKLFERILFMRIVKVLGKHNMIDLSQHGGMAHRSSADPIRILAEVMEDAEQSGQEFHLFSADLSKAFDSLEFWSQAMSWRALGMPEEMAMMLMNLDEMAESEVILGQGRTTSTVLGEEGWFKSGRGVRQGSIGGPIKWIVYMNFWLKYVDKKREGEGYRMSKDPSAILRSQMFVDDSNWAARTVEGMNGMIHSGDTFVGFHGLEFNKKKSEYVVMNQKMEAEGTWERPRWPGGQELVETIRVVGAMEGVREARLEAATERANKILHSATSGARESEVKARPCEYWRELQMRVDEEAKHWQTKNEQSWWKGEGRNEDLTGLYETVKEAKGLGTWRPMSDNPDIEREAESMVHKWVAVQDTIQRMQVQSGTAMRYLGVWFEGGGKWIRQRKILDTKFRDANDRITRSCPTREQAIYCINATINAALKFPLQVANVPKGVLEEWDRKNRAVVRAAGYLPRATPIELMHLPKNEGGLGLESLREAVGRIQIARYMTMLNTDNRSLTAKMVRAGRSRFREHGSRGASLHGRTVSDLEDRGMEITEAYEQENGRLHLRFDWFGKQLEEDEKQAHSVPRTGGIWEAYGDGATYSHENRAGWGRWAVNREARREGRGRLQGEQLNDGAEAMAILETLKETNPNDTLEIYCDNTSCVSKWNKLINGNTYAMEWGYRAIWNRIQGLLSVRNKCGSQTSMRWVHSHVDDESRRTSKTSKMTCACREEGETECNPAHRHHIGNEKADEQAKQGAREQGGDEWGEAAKGEMWFVIRDKDGFAQGSYKEWLKRRATEALIDWGGTDGDGTTTPKWAQAVRAADRGIMLSVLRKVDIKGAASWRFWSRVLCQTLPTHARMMKFANSSSQNDYKEVYGGHVGPLGKCVTCGDELETVEHALVKCPAVGKIWHVANGDIACRWERDGLDWGEWSWLEERSRWETWSPIWGTPGLVPKTAQETIQRETGMGAIAAFTLLRDTAMIILEASREAWKWRVEATQIWEKQNETMHMKKVEMNRTTWAKGATKEKKQRLESEGAKLSREKKEKETKCKERAANWEKTNQMKMDKDRHEKGKVPMSANEAEQRIENAQTWAVKKMRLETRKAGTLARIAVGTNELSTVKEAISEMQRRDPRQADLPQQEGQTGLWFPEVGTEVKTMRRNPGGIPSWESGKTMELEWKEGEPPRMLIEYTRGQSQWHDVVLEAGRCVRLKEGESMETLVTVPVVIRELLGHGTELQVTWVNNKKVTKWHVGKIVAIDGKRWAIRYEGSKPASVAWHDPGDIESRGLVIVTARRKGEHTNESYQGLNHNRAAGCLLLTDEGKCACEVCTEKGWPMEVAEAGEELNQGNTLQSMGPVEGRIELNRRREEKRRREGSERRRQKNRRKIQSHIEDQVQTERERTKLGTAGEGDREKVDVGSDQQEGSKEGQIPETRGSLSRRNDILPHKGSARDTHGGGPVTATDTNRGNADAERAERPAADERLEPESDGNPGQGDASPPQQGNERTKKHRSHDRTRQVGYGGTGRDERRPEDRRPGRTPEENPEHDYDSPPKGGNIGVGDKQEQRRKPAYHYQDEGNEDPGSDERAARYDQTVVQERPRPGYVETPEHGSEHTPRQGNEEPVDRTITARNYDRGNTVTGRGEWRTEGNGPEQHGRPEPGPRSDPGLGDVNMPQMGGQSAPDLGHGNNGAQRPTEGETRQYESGGRKSNRRPREEGYREPRRQSEKRPEETYSRSDKEQSCGEDNRNRERDQDMGMVCESNQKQDDHNETHRGRGQILANTTRTDDKRNQVRCSLGRTMDIQEKTSGAGGQGRGTGSSKGMALPSRGTPERRRHGTETREEGGPQISQIELVQEVGWSRSPVRDNSPADHGGGSDHGDRQRVWGGEGHKYVMADSIDEVAGSDGLDTRRDERPTGTSGNRKARSLEEGAEDERRERREEDHGHRGGMGINRDCGVKDTRMCDDRSRQSGIPGPGPTLRPSDKQNRHGPLLERIAECSQENSQESLERTGIVHNGMAITRVQNPNYSQLDERDERMYEWAATEGSEERDGPEHTTRERDRIPAMSGGHREPDGGTGPRNKQRSICHGEPVNKRPMESGFSEGEDLPERYVASDNSRSVRVRKEMQKTDKNSDEPRRLEPDRDYGRREVHGGRVRGNGEQPKGPPPEQARTVNDNIGPEEETERGEGSRSEGKEGIQRKSRKEPSPSGTSDRNSRSRISDPRKGNREQEDNAGSETRKRKPSQQSKYDPRKKARRPETGKRKRAPELGEGPEGGKEEEGWHGVKEVRTMEDRLPPVKALRKGEG